MDQFAIKTLYRTFSQSLMKALERKKNISRLKTTHLKRVKNSSYGCIWFHAASVGELEALWPIVFQVLPSERVIVTIFSSSAEPTLQKLEKAITERFSKKLVFAGFSPEEGNWLQAFEFYEPKCFVTSKYEAWPDLWMSLAEKEIPLVIVGAKARKSLRLAKFVCKLGLGKLPPLTFLLSHESDRSSLKTLFPEAVIPPAMGDPRWDRVAERALQGNLRAKALIQMAARLPKPWGIVGSVWSTDLKVWPKTSTSKPLGTIWWVPHDLKHVKEVSSQLRELGYDPILSSQMSSELNFTSESQCLLVDEMGVLAELYSASDWAYVGGGFGIGIHSTIEPGLHGIPVACGPNGTLRFNEVHDLMEYGQLSVLKNTKDFSQWIEKMNERFTQGVPNQDVHQERNVWLQQANGRLGAHFRIASHLKKGWGEPQREVGRSL